MEFKAPFLTTDEQKRFMAETYGPDWNVKGPFANLSLSSDVNTSDQASPHANDIVDNVHLMRERIKNPVVRKRKRVSMVTQKVNVLEPRKLNVKRVQKVTSGTNGKKRIQPVALSRPMTSFTIPNGGLEANTGNNLLDARMSGGVTTTGFGQQTSTKQNNDRTNQLLSEIAQVERKQSRVVTDQRRVELSNQTSNQTSDQTLDHVNKVVLNQSVQAQYFKEAELPMKGHIQLDKKRIDYMYDPQKIQTMITCSTSNSESKERKILWKDSIFGRLQTIALDHKLTIFNYTKNNVHKMVIRSTTSGLRLLPSLLLSYAPHLLVLQNMNGTPYLICVDIQGSVLSWKLNFAHGDNMPHALTPFSNGAFVMLKKRSVVAPWLAMKSSKVDNGITSFHSLSLIASENEDPSLSITLILRSRPASDILKFGKVESVQTFLFSPQLGLWMCGDAPEFHQLSDFKDTLINEDKIMSEKLVQTNANSSNVLTGQGELSAQDLQKTEMKSAQMASVLFSTSKDVQRSVTLAHIEETIALIKFFYHANKKQDKDESFLRWWRIYITHLVDRGLVQRIEELCKILTSAKIIDKDYSLCGYANDFLLEKVMLPLMSRSKRCQSLYNLYKPKGNSDPW